MIISLQKYYDWKQNRISRKFAEQFKWKKKFAWLPIRIINERPEYVWLETVYYRKERYGSGCVYRTKDEHIVEKLKNNE